MLHYLIRKVVTEDTINYLKKAEHRMQHPEL